MQLIPLISEAFPLKNPFFLLRARNCRHFTLHPRKDQDTLTPSMKAEIELKVRENNEMEFSFILDFKVEVLLQ